MQEEEKQRDFYNLLEACAAGDLPTVKTILGKLVSTPLDGNNQNITLDYTCLSMNQNLSSSAAIYVQNWLIDSTLCNVIMRVL
jgi:hypothetical protein